MIRNIIMMAQSKKKMPVGLSPVLLSLSGVSSVWSEQSIDVSAYEGQEIRIVFKHAAGPSYVGDIQLDNMRLGSHVADFETTNDSYETTSSNTLDYTAGIFTALPTSTTASRFNRDSGGTGSTGTGLTTAGSGTFYVYSETSTPFNVTRWLRSPIFTADGNTLLFQEARHGAAADLGTMEVYIDVIS